MSWAARVVDTITGVTQAPIALASFSGSRVIDDMGSGSVSLPVASSPFGKVKLRELFALDSRSIVFSRNGVDVYRGQFTDVAVTDGILTAQHKDIRYLLGKRTTFGSNGYSGNLPTNNNLPLVNYTLASMPSWLVWACTEGPTPNFDLPIFIAEGKVTYALVNSLPHTGTESRTYWDYEVHFVGEALAELAKLGVETDFEPRANVSGGSELLLRVGTITGGSSDCMMNSGKPWLLGWSSRSNSDKRANVLHAIGKGSEMDMRERSAQADPSVPAMERAVNYKDIDDVSVLQQHANADLALYKGETRQVGLSMLADSGPAIENMRLGHKIRAYFKDDVWELDGWQEFRLIGFSFDQTETVSLTVQPWGA